MSIWRYVIILLIYKLTTCIGYPHRIQPCVFVKRSKRLWLGFAAEFYLSDCRCTIRPHIVEIHTFDMRRVFDASFGTVYTNDTT